MNLVSLICGFIGNLILIFGQVYCWKKLSNNKVSIISKKIIFKILIYTILTFSLHYLVPSYLRGVFIIIVSILMCRNIIKLSIRESIILAFVSQIIDIVSESILIACTTLVFNIDLYSVASTEIISIIFDVVITIIIYLLLKIKIFNKLYDYLIKITNNIKLFQLIAFVLFIFLAIWMFCATIFFKNNVLLLVILNSVISIIYAVIIIYIFRYQSKYNSISSKYNIIIDSLQSQEQLINDYRVLNHENKNNLLTIKQMTNNKKVIGYINSLTKNYSSYNKINDNEYLKLPSIGIRALIYNKLLIMQENNIKYNLEIDKLINMKDLINLSNDNIVDICQILGVFLDNAIEESLKLDNSLVNISFFYNDDKIEISVSNKLHNQFETEKVLIKKETTKGNNRGHGLKLVKKVVQNNNNLECQTKIFNNVISQTIVIDYKKKDLSNIS